VREHLDSLLSEGRGKEREMKYWGRENKCLKLFVSLIFTEMCTSVLLMENKQEIICH